MGIITTHKKHLGMTKLQKKNLLNCRNRIRIFARSATSVLPQSTRATYKFHHGEGVLFPLKASVVSCFEFHRFLEAKSSCVELLLRANFSSLRFTSPDLLGIQRVTSGDIRLISAPEPLVGGSNHKRNKFLGAK